MLALLDQVREPFVASPEEAVIAREAVTRLKPLADAKIDVKLRVVDGAEVIVPLPARAVDLIVSVLETMAEGKAVSFIPYAAELTTQQAADFLNVSRPFFVTLLTKGEVAHRMVGTHRRVRMSDLIDYKKRSEVQRCEAIARMVSEAQRLDLP
jgi:excisionase family DNA binding protein